VQVQQEREQKFDVGRGWVYRERRRVPDGGTVGQETLALESVYFDTDHGLLDLGVTLRRRVEAGTLAGS
jgi:inorganic triphosphatase YgiF